MLLSGDRDAALKAIKELVSVSGSSSGEGTGVGSAVVMNLIARLLHDTGNLQGAVDAYLMALKVSPFLLSVCLSSWLLGLPRASFWLRFLVAISRSFAHIHHHMIRKSQHSVRIKSVSGQVVSTFSGTWISVDNLAQLLIMACCALSYTLKCVLY